jgi:hypothetical protein
LFFSNTPVRTFPDRETSTEPNGDWIDGSDVPQGQRDTHGQVATFTYDLLGDDVFEGFNVGPEKMPPLALPDLSVLSVLKPIHIYCRSSDAPVWRELLFFRPDRPSQKGPGHEKWATDEQATSSEVLRLLGWYAQELDSGDIFLKFSGHGGQVLRRSLFENPGHAGHADSQLRAAPQARADDHLLALRPPHFGGSTALPAVRCAAQYPTPQQRRTRS